MVTDVCLCEYTSHGHCGVVEGGEVQNDPTLELLARMAVSHARAGRARGGALRHDGRPRGRDPAGRSTRDGFADVAILSYAAKYASAFYGPFREAADSAPQFGDRRGYQMDPANAREALREVRLDVEEGADMVMVKPALPYLDVIRAVRERVDVPVAAYNVSGEYAMVKAAAERGWIDEAADRAGDADLDRARGRRRHPHLPRQGLRRLAWPAWWTVAARAVITESPVTLVDAPRRAVPWALVCLTFLDGLSWVVLPGRFVAASVLGAARPGRRALRRS